MKGDCFIQRVVIFLIVCALKLPNELLQFTTISINTEIWQKLKSMPFVDIA